MDAFDGRKVFGVPAIQETMRDLTDQLVMVIFEMSDCVLHINCKPIVREVDGKTVFFKDPFIFSTKVPLVGTIHKTKSGYNLLIEEDKTSPPKIQCFEMLDYVEDDE